MAHPDRRNNIASHNEGFTNQTMEDIEQTRYKTKFPLDYREYK